MALFPSHNNYYITHYKIKLVSFWVGGRVLSIQNFIKPETSLLFYLFTEILIEV